LVVALAPASVVVVVVLPAVVVVAVAVELAAVLVVVAAAVVVVVVVLVVAAVVAVVVAAAVLVVVAVVVVVAAVVEALRSGRGPRAGPPSLCSESWSAATAARLANAGAVLLLVVGLALGLYTILPLPILYGVWHTKGGGGGGGILRISLAILLQQCGQCRSRG